MAAIIEIDGVSADEFQIQVVDQGGGGQLGARLPAEEPAGDEFQILIDQRHERFWGGWRTGGPVAEQSGDVRAFHGLA